MKHSFYCHVDAGGKHSAEVLSRVHGCLPENVGLAFALGTLKQGGINPDTVSDSAADAGGVRDHVAKLRRGVFSAFNTCLARYLSARLEPQFDSRSDVNGSTTRCDAVISTDSSSPSCQLCSIIGRLALHAADCKLHHRNCSDQCQPMYNLVGYHLGSCEPSICKAALCDELRMALLEQQPVEPPGDGLDRVWRNLRIRLASILPPPPAADVLELFRRYSGLQAGDGYGSIDGSGSVARTSSDSLGPAPWTLTALTGSAHWVHDSSSSVAAVLATDCGSGNDVESSCSSSSSSSIVDVNGGSSSSGILRPSAPQQQQQHCDVTGRLRPHIPTGEELERFVMEAYSIGTLLRGGNDGDSHCGPGSSRMAVSTKDVEVPPECGASCRNDIGKFETIGCSDSSDIGLPKFSLLVGSGGNSFDGSGTSGANQHVHGGSVLCSADTEVSSEQGEQKLLSETGSSLALPKTMMPSVGQSRQSGRLDSGMKILGQGYVSYGEPRHLLEVVRYWKVLQERLQDRVLSNDSPPDDVDSDIWEGVILTGKDCQLVVKDGNYQKRVHWFKQAFLGRGVCGHVELAIDKDTEFNFVIKKVELRSFSHDELSIWAELEHPGIVQLYGALRHGQKLYYLCEFYASNTLTSLIHRSRALDQWKALFYLEQILTVLAYLHEKKIIHEDLKADNIFLKPNSQFLGVGDFGLSCKLIPGQNSVVAGKQPLGGQTQWSPEKARSDGHGVAADVWAAMCTMVHMLSGHHPWELRFKGCHMLHYVIAINSPPVDDIPVGLLDEVKDLILSGWTMDPHCRPTAAQLLRHPAFDHLRSGCPTDPMYKGHFHHLQSRYDDISEYSATDDESEGEFELGEDGEQYVAELVEMALRQSGVSATASASHAAGSTLPPPSYLLTTEFDLKTCSGGRLGGPGNVGCSNVTVSHERAPAQPSTGGKASAQLEISELGDDSSNSANTNQLGAEGHSAVLPQSHWRVVAGRESHMQARRRPLAEEAIEEEPSDEASDVACSKRASSAEPSNSSTICRPPATISADVSVVQPCSAGMTTAIAAVTESPAFTDEVLSSSIGGGRGVPGSGRLRRQKGPGLFVDVQAAASGPSPPSPSLRHSYSVDSGESYVRSPPTGDGSGSEGKRVLKHAVTSPSILVSSRTSNSDRDRQQASPVLMLQMGQQQQQQQQRCTPPSASGLSLGLSSADLSAGAFPCQQPTSSAYGSGVTPSRPQSTAASNPWDLAAGDSPARRKSSQGYVTDGCTPDSGGSVFAAGAVQSGSASRVGAKSGIPTLQTDVSRAAFAELVKSRHTVADNDRYVCFATVERQLFQRAGSDGHLPNDVTASPAISAIAAEKSVGSSTEGDVGCSYSSSNDSSAVLRKPDVTVGMTADVLASPNDSGPSPPGMPSGGGAAANASAGPSSFAALDLGFLTTSSSDMDLDMAPDAANLQRQSGNGTAPTNTAIELNLCLPEKQDGVHSTNEVDADKEEKEYLSMLQQSIKLSHSNICLSSAHAVLMAGDGSRVVSKGQEIGKLKISPEMTWQEGVLLMSHKVHEQGFDSYTVVFENGGELPLHDKIPVQTVTLMVKVAADCDPGQWWIANNELKFSEEGPPGPFLDSRS